jgi:hypothetical protein
MAGVIWEPERAEQNQYDGWAFLSDAPVHPLLHLGLVMVRYSDGAQLLSLTHGFSSHP